MDIFSFAGVAVVICLLLVLLHQQNKEMGTAAMISAGVVMMIVILNTLAPALSSISDMLKNVEVSRYVSPVLRGLGVCIVTQAASDICRDSGQRTVAGYVELAGRVSLLLIALPLFSDLLNTAVVIING